MIFYLCKLDNTIYGVLIIFLEMYLKDKEDEEDDRKE